MKTRFPACALATAFSLALASPPAIAQRPPVAAVPPVPPVPPAPPVPATSPPPRATSLPSAVTVDVAVPTSTEEKRFDLILEAATPAQEVIDALSEKIGHPVNVVWSGESASAPLPALRLHQVTLREFLAAVTSVGRTEMRQGRTGFEFTEIPEAPNVYTFSMTAIAQPTSPIPRAPGHGGAMNQLNSQNGAVATFAAAPEAPPKISQFFDLSALLTGKLTIDDVTTAIRTAWTAATDGAEPATEALKYHEETQLLIATGTPERLKTVENIVDLLRTRTQPSREQKDQEIARLTRDLQETNKDREMATARVRESDERHEAELSELRKRIAELEIELAKQRKSL